MIREYLYDKRMGIVHKYVQGYADLDIGAGKEPKAEITIDILRRLEPDIVADLNSLPIRTGAFRSVVCSHVIEHTPDPDQAMEEIARVLSNDGLVFFFLPDDYSLLWRILEPLWAMYYSKFVIREASSRSHTASFNLESFRALLQRHFSKVVELSKINNGAEIYAICRK